MRFFTKKETIFVSATLLVILSLSLYNFTFALRRARDSQRREDLGTIYNALGRYQAEFGFFPLSSPDGKIKACKPDNYDELVKVLSKDIVFDQETYLEALSPCSWGVDALSALSEGENNAYLTTIPQDPMAGRGISYFYISNSRQFQIYAYLEGGTDEVGYQKAIVGRNLACGKKICNFGRAYGAVPLDKSLEEYENEILRQNMN